MSDDKAEYMRTWRRTNTARSDKLARTARAKALERLREKHPEDFLIVHNAERARRDLPPVGESKRGRPQRGVRKELER